MDKGLLPNKELRLTSIKNWVLFSFLKEPELNYSVNVQYFWQRYQLDENNESWRTKSNQHDNAVPPNKNIVIH